MKTKELFVSVVILNYNKPNDTIRSIASIKNQTLQNYEIIIVDDHSTDRSVDIICERFPDVRLVALAKNQGRSAWNEGMRVARGEVFLLLDADMYLSKNFLAKLVDKFIKFPTVRAMTFNLKDPSGRTRGWVPVHTIEKTPEGSYEAFAATLAIRKAVYETVGGFNPDFFLYVEYEYYINLLQHGFVVHYFPDLIAFHTDSPNPYRSIMKGYHVVKNQMQLYALYLPLRKWPKFLGYHQKQFSRVLLIGGADRVGLIKGLLFGFWFFLRSFPKRKVLDEKSLQTFMRFYFPKKGDVIVDKWGWNKIGKIK